MKPLKPLIIRADASKNIGCGHVMRCLALAEKWRDCGGEVIWITNSSDFNLEKRWQNIGAKLEFLNCVTGSRLDLKLTIEKSRSSQAEWVVVDGYQFGVAFLNAIKSAGFKMLWIDDLGCQSRVRADLILNQNLHASIELYPKIDYETQLLLGSAYCLLRSEVLKEKSNQHRRHDVKRILVVMGSSDVRKLIHLVVESFSVSKLDVKFIVMAPADLVGQLEIDSSAVKEIVVEEDFNKLVYHMSSCDLAISAAGSTCWELAYMGVPLLVVPVAENQIRVADELSWRGIARNLGWYENLTPAGITRELIGLFHDSQGRHAMSAKGSSLFDGKGAERVVRQMNLNRIRLRKMELSDCLRVWEWANDEEVRRVSFNKEKIAWEDHQKWFKKKLEDSHTIFWMVIDEFGAPIGSVRFDISTSETEAVMHISIDNAKRGFGYGTAIINCAVSSLFKKKVRQIHAYIKPDNLASVRAFEKAGFSKIDLKSVKGNPANHLMIEKVSKTTLLVESDKSHVST